MVKISFLEFKKAAVWDELHSHSWSTQVRACRGGLIKSKGAKDHTCRLETVEKFIGLE